MTIFQQYDMFVQYLNNGQGNFRSTVERVLMDNSTPFPTVTICNFNRAMKSKLLRDKVDQRVLEYAYGAIPVTYDFSMRSLMQLAFWEHNIQEYEKLWHEYTKGKKIDIGDLLRRYGHDCNLTVLRVVFSGYDVSPDSLCDRMTEVITRYGRCWVYSTNESQTRPGRRPLTACVGTSSYSICLQVPQAAYS